MANPSKKTCFIISPIGADGTDTRKVADDFLELLIEPALEKYGFDVIRGDRIANSSAITSDIVRLVQESDLCIIDLTANNPNVFYECGRRHETGRPFIQMIRKGDDKALPFDVAGIRTLSYDISSPRAVLESKRKLQEFIDALVSTGFEAGTSGESLSSIAQSLERIERKLNVIVASPQVPMSTATSGEGDEEDLSIRDLVTSPRESYIRALKRGQIDKALSILPKLEKTVSRSEYVTALALPVSMGDPRAFEIMDQLRQELLLHPLDEEDRDDLIKAISQAYQSHYGNTGDYKAGLGILDGMCSAIVSSDAFSKDAKAFVANKVGMLAWQARDYAQCIRSTKLALGIFPEPSYAYNLALVYDHEEMKAELAETLVRLSQMPDLDSDHRRLLKEHGIPVR